MRSWQRDMIRDLNKTANEPCRCENNGDLCPRCDARDQLKAGRVPRLRDKDLDLMNRVSRIFQTVHSCTQSFSDWKVTEMTASELQDVLDRQKDVAYNRISGGL